MQSVTNRRRKLLQEQVSQARLLLLQTWQVVVLILLDEVKAAGGLRLLVLSAMIGRVDRQLRGRSGRLGDPGSSQFYASLEDDLMD